MPLVNALASFLGCVESSMARTDVTVRDSTSNAIPMQLLAGTVGIDLSAVGTVELWLRDSAGGTKMTDNLTGKITIPSASAGSVTYTPGTTDLVSGSAPYSGYFKVYVTPTSWYYVPEDSEVTINVRPRFT